MSTSPCEWFKKLVADPNDAEFAALPREEFFEVYHHVVSQDCETCTESFNQLAREDPEKFSQLGDRINALAKSVH